MNRNQKILITIVSLAFLIPIGSAFYYYSIKQTETENLKVVVTFYPLAYFAKEIGGEHVSVTQLIPNNTEAHSWNPTVRDITVTDDAAIIVYNGANLDHWIETDIIPILKDTSSKLILETTDGVELLETKTPHKHGKDLYDPHTWISPLIAKQQAQRIYEALVQKDPVHERYYTDRWELIKTRFEELDQAYMEGLSNKTKEVIFVTHAAFGYLAHRYGFEQHGVIGISADEQPSVSAIATLIEMMIEHETYVVYINPVYSDEYAQTLKNELESRTAHSVQILKLYLMLGPIDNMDYFEQQWANLENLKKGLGVP